MSVDCWSLLCSGLCLPFLRDRKYDKTIIGYMNREIGSRDTPDKGI